MDKLLKKYRYLFLTLVFILFLQGCVQDFIPVIKDNFYRHVEFLSSDELVGRSVASRGDSLARYYIASQFEQFGLLPGNDSSYFQAFTYPGDLYHGLPDSSGKIAYNVLGLLSGKDSSSTVVIGAHYDHIGIKYIPGTQDTICNGADDNASGVALMLELARRTANAREPECNVLFIGFTAEESALLGSDYFLRNQPQAIHQIKAMLNFDMVGRLRENTLYINHCNSAAFWNELIEDANLDSLIIIKDALNARNDGVCFAGVQIPVIWFFTGLHEDMHQVTDEIDRINFLGMTKVYFLAARILRQLIH